jgi:luciferase family oxidoreductase group 1
MAWPAPHIRIMSYRLSVLDQSPITAGSTATQALRNTIDLAQHAEALGYHRYWMAEHHATPALAGAAPEAMIGPVALATRHIRVGSGGIMLPHYSPFKVAETFALLSALAPGRIDLGLGRAPGSDQRTALALQRDRTKRMPMDFPQALDELASYFDGTLPQDHAFKVLEDTLPAGGGTPELWMLGSSPDSAMWAAERGMPYCFADFINPNGADLARLYRRNFRPGRLDAPYVIAATWTIAAETRQEAERQAMPSRMMMAHLYAGQLIPVPSIETAQAWLADQTTPPSRQRRSVLGTPAEVHAQLDQVAADYAADEMMLVNILADHAARKRSYTLVAEEYGLAKQVEAA